MAEIQRAVAICLTASSAFSAFLLYLNRTKDAKIKLPTHDIAHDQDIDATSCGDPFNVVNPDDLSEGQPIDERTFWSRVGIFV